jgi:hypothetical protein
MSPDAFPNFAPFIIIGAVSLPLGLWKLIEIVLWIASHVRWVAP